MSNISKRELKMVCSDFRDYGSRLLTTNDDDGINDTKRLLNYINNTKIIKEYIDKCINNLKSELDIEKVRKNMEFRDKYPLPIERDDEVAFTYSLLTYGINKFSSYCAFAMNGYSSSSNLIQDYIDNFNDQVVRHFINNIVKYLEQLSITAKDTDEATEENVKIFISYCWADKDVVDLIDKDFQEFYGITFTRDERDLKFKQSIKLFMQSLCKHDYVVMIISDSYIKSDNCMYEVMEVMRDREYKNKIYLIILSEDDKVYYDNGSLEKLKAENKSISANIYNIEGRVNYAEYWEAKEDKILELIDRLKNHVTKIEPSIELKRIRNISENIGEFLETISDMKNESLKSLRENNYKEFIDSMNIDIANLTK